MTLPRATGKRLPRRICQKNLVILALQIAVLAFSFALPPLVHAADPALYTVTLRATGDAALDSALSDASNLVALRETSPPNPFSLVLRAQQDVVRLQAVLRSLGFYRGTVTIRVAGQPLDAPGLTDELVNAPAAPPSTVDIAIEPGPAFTIGAVTLNGPVPPEIAARLTLVPGVPATAANVLAGRDQLLTMLRDAGHAVAAVDLPPAVLRPGDRKLDVALNVTAGPVVNIGPLAFAGLGEVHEDFIRQHLRLRQGDRFSPTALENARSDLVGLGVFSSVRAEPANRLDADGRLPIVFQTTERARHAVSADASYSTDLGVTVGGSWHHRNLLGNAEQLNVTGSVQLGGNAVVKPGFSAGVEFVKPDFLVRDQTLTLDVAAVKRSLFTYDQRAVTEKAILTRTLTPRWSIGLGLTGEQEQIAQEGITRSYNLVGVPLQVKYDSTTNLLDPVSGFRASLLVTPTYALGSRTALFVTAQVAASAYFDLADNGRSVLAVRGLVGEIFGAANAFGLPPDQRFYAGGSATVRGFRYQSIGPQFADGHPVGATAVAAGSLEVRQRIGENFGAVGFVDVGQASARGAPFSSNWHAGAGVGLRYYTSIGPIRLDVAVPLNRVPHGDSFELYIGIGQAF
jgi:translocation and assembly module TamA